MKQAEPAAAFAALKRDILGIGFDRVGFAPVGSVPGHARYEAWLNAGYAGGMDYLERHRELRRDPATLLPEARSVIMVSLNYYHGDPESPPQRRGHGRVSRYARGRDYHKVMRYRLRRVETLLRESQGAAATRSVVDSAPLLERSLAAGAGLGWIGKNTLLIDERLGSYTFLGAVLSDLALPADPPVAERCGSCRACLDACPTAAFPEPGLLDARRCISTLTIEHRGEIPLELAALMGDHLFGCDVCQEVCPWNRKAPQTAVADFQPREGQSFPLLAELVELDRRGLVSRFAGTALMRAGEKGLARNARVVLANESQTAKGEEKHPSGEGGRPT